LLTIRSLRPRLILIVGFALAPLALASIGQGFLRVGAHHKEVENRLRNTSVYATRAVQAVFPDAKQFMERLAQRPELKAGGVDCRKLLRDSLLSTPLYVNIAVIDRSGRTNCVASPEHSPPNYAGFRWWHAMISQRAFIVGNQYREPASGRDIVPVALPLYDRSGLFTGALSLSIDTRQLDRNLAANKLPEDAIVLLLDQAGNILASNKPVANNLARKVAALGRDNFSRTFMTSADGAGKWRWAAQPVGHGGMLVAFGMPESWLIGITPIYIFVDILLPLLMILFAWGAIWLGTEWLAIRWTIYLENLSVAYGRGEFAVETSELDLAPDEFRLLGNEMKKMAQSIQARDFKLSQALRQEKSLAREIHHRVKNNLQIVSSLISVFSRHVVAPDARKAFQQITVRVDALSLVHRLIEKSGQLPVVAMKTLLTELAEQIRVSAEAHDEQCSITLDICDCQLPMDIATPITLFAVEALSMERAGPGSDALPLLLSLQTDGPDHLLLSIVVEKPDGATSRHTPPPMRVLTALAGQIGGRTWMEETAEGTCCVSLRFSRPAPSLHSRVAFDDDLGWGDGEKSLTGRIYDLRENNDRLERNPVL